MRVQGEIFAAEGYGKVTGEVGVCIATSGPGATNLVTGLADALLDSVPMVAITGQVGCPFMLSLMELSWRDGCHLSYVCCESWLEEQDALVPDVFHIASRAGPKEDDWHRCFSGNAHCGGHQADYKAQLPGHGCQGSSSYCEGGRPTCVLVAEGIQQLVSIGPAWLCLQQQALLACHLGPGCHNPM